MTDSIGAIRDAFEHTDYDLGEVSVNRGKTRIAVLEEGADPDALRAVVEEAVGADAIMAFDVRTETVGADDALGTVVTFRNRG